ncbi:MAG: glycosyltransferase [bacterium]|nr:glycosyltransferase [bacterium]
MKLNANKKIFIAWGRETRRGRQIAEAVGAEFKQIYYKKIKGVNVPLILRYFFQTAATIAVLIKRRPGIIIAQNPPVFAPLAVMLYSKLSGAKYAIDSHTAAFLDQKWKIFYPLFKFAAERAVLNSCHNYKNLEILKSWNIKPAMALHSYYQISDSAALDAPLDDQALGRALDASRLPVMMVNRFVADDDWQTVFKTAALMPEADFFITGDPREARHNLGNLPANVFLTGYLTHQEFLKLMRRARVVLAFTLRPDTVLWSIREAIALGKPFITTDNQVLRHYFGQAGLFAGSNAEQIKEKILQAVVCEAEIKNKISDFIKQDSVRWRDEIQEYTNYLT